MNTQNMTTPPPHFFKTNYVGDSYEEVRRVSKNYRVSHNVARLWIDMAVSKSNLIESMNLKADTSNPFGTSPKANPFSDSPIPVCDSSMTVHGDVLVIFDLHNPTYNKEFLYKACLLAKKYGIKKVLFGGDMNNCNQWNSKHMLSEKRRFQDDLELLGDTFSIMKDDFGFSLHAILGNHDMWFLQYMKGEFDHKWIMEKLLGKIEVAPVEWCNVESGGELFQINHGANYSSANPLGMVQKLASKYHCHIIAGHQHHFAVGVDVSGRFQCIASGGMFDATRVRYIQERHKTNPAQQNGFVIIKDGYASHYTPSDPEIKNL